jgi:large subunit ribosomal protein L32
MLSFDIGALQEHAARVDGFLAEDDAVWQDGDPKPAGAVHATGRLSPAGPGQYYWNGRIEGTVGGACRRCLTTLSAPVIVMQQCPKCGSMKRPHRVCQECGFYAGKQRVAAREG